ncbi:MAG: V-type ATP synthase subunit K [Kiritimatiellae bacterium]|jgi:V/A-type H+-transporting ATPase subunit K|nr:V-type ATP synthase subunit K [Kiritimatiellia bacterium]MBR5588261.1 V-type ATP synthase subunit K [Kiritimatiellia bacterium]
MDTALTVAGAVACLALSGLGSAIGTGLAAAGAVGAWKKCYAQNRPAPFLLLAYVGAPITQTLYGMILMFTMIGTQVVTGGGIGMLILGIFAGLGIGMSAIFQGRAGGCAADAQGETSQGFTNNLAALGIVETTAIFVMVFTLIAVGSLAAA